MKKLKILLLFVSLVCVTQVFSQAVTKLTGDSILASPNGFISGSVPAHPGIEFRLRNLSRVNKGGLLTNIDSNGLTKFIRPRQSGDTLFVGLDTFLIAASVSHCDTLYSINDSTLRWCTCFGCTDFHVIGGSVILPACAISVDTAYLVNDTTLRFCRSDVCWDVSLKISGIRYAIEDNRGIQDRYIDYENFRLWTANMSNFITSGTNTTNGTTSDRFTQFLDTLSSGDATADRYPRGVISELFTSGNTDFDSPDGEVIAMQAQLKLNAHITTAKGWAGLSRVWGWDTNFTRKMIAHEFEVTVSAPAVQTAEEVIGVRSMFMHQGGKLITPKYYGMDVSDSNRTSAPTDLTGVDTSAMYHSHNFDIGVVSLGFWQEGILHSNIFEGESNYFYNIPGYASGGSNVVVLNNTTKRLELGAVGSGGGTTPDLQAVTDVGFTTTNQIISTSTIGFSVKTVGNQLLSELYENGDGTEGVMGLYSTDARSTQFHMDSIILAHDNGDAGNILILKYPESATRGSYYLPISINGTFADAAGNITVSTGIGSETDAIALAKTITENDGYGLIETATATQALSTNPSWTRRIDTFAISTRTWLYKVADSLKSTIISTAGTVTSVATNTATGITGGTITTTGTLAIDTFLISTRAWRQKLADSLGNLISSVSPWRRTSLSGASSSLNIVQTNTLADTVVVGGNGAAILGSNAPRGVFNVSGKAVIGTTSTNQLTIAYDATHQFTMSVAADGTTTLDNNATFVISKNIALQNFSTSVATNNFEMTSISALSSTTGGTLAGFSLAGAGTTNFRVGIGHGNNVTLGGNNAYGTLILGNNGSVSEASSGTHPLISNLALTALIIGNGVGSTTDATDLYIAGPPTGITPTNTATAMWINNGAVKMTNTTSVPSSQVSGTILFYADAGEFKVRDDAGNVTTLSPHDPDGLPNGLPGMHWSYHSEKNGKYIAVDMYKLAELVEKLSGEKLIYTGKTKDLK